MAELISWSPKYSVNHPVMDAQHKQLIGLINELYSAMCQRRGKDVLQKILDELIKYTKVHFGSEEKLMRDMNYVEFAQHRHIHKILTQQVIRLQNKFKEGKILLSIEVMEFLKNWLINHIQGTDKKYSKVI